MEVVLIAAAIIASIVVLVKLWVHVIVPTYEFLENVWYNICCFVEDYIIDPIKWVCGIPAFFKEKKRRAGLTPEERREEDLAKLDLLCGIAEVLAEHNVEVEGYEAAKALNESEEANA